MQQTDGGLNLRMGCEYRPRTHMFVLLVPKSNRPLHQAAFSFSKFGVFGLLIVLGKLIFQINNGKVCNSRAANSQDSWQAGACRLYG